MVRSRRYFSVLARVPVLVLIATPYCAEAQRYGNDTLALTIEAIQCLKASDRARTWNEGFHRAAASEIIASGNPLLALDTAGGELARIQGGRERPSAFTIAGVKWPCLGPDEFVAARCALATSRYYVHVSDPVIRGDSAFVPATVFVKDARTPSGMRWLQALIELVHDGTGWRLVRVSGVEM